MILENDKKLMEKVVALSKRRGFIYPSCEIYGGFANAYSYGPYGTELKNNIKNLWWKKFVTEREDIIGFDGPIMLNSKVWDASGHTKGFNDAMVDCKNCKARFRADQIVNDATGEDLEGNLKELDIALKDLGCPNCGKKNWTNSRFVNLMFTTKMNGVNSDVYLRPETAGAIFVDYKSVIDSVRTKIPFGIAQIGKAFRNEIVARNFIFRVREFEQMEIEYFINPKEKWEKVFNKFLDLQKEFAKEIGANSKDLREYEHPEEKLSHYSKKTVDIEYNFPFGFSELYGLAHRTDFDLKAHQKDSGADLQYTDPLTHEKYIPHVIEPTFGLERSILAALCSAYTEEKIGSEERVVMKFPNKIAPIKVAVFPLLKNKPELINVARSIFNQLKVKFTTEYDDSGNIGKRYRRQDEIGTPVCITIDFDTLTDNTVTFRDRDTMEQRRVRSENIIEEIEKTINN